MDHSYFRDKISAYFDNELPPQEKEIIEQHLAQCQECQDLLAELKRLDRTVEKHSQLGGKEYWEQSAQRIEQRLGFAEETKVTDITPSGWKGLVPKLAAVAASIAVLGFIALYEKEISREAGLYAPATTEPVEIVPKDQTSGVSEEALKVYEEEIPKKKDISVSVGGAEEVAKKRGKVKQPAVKAPVSTWSVPVTETAEVEPEAAQRMAGKEKVLPIQEDELATISETLQKVEGMATGRSGETIYTPTSEKAVVLSKAVVPESAELITDIIVAAKGSSKQAKLTGLQETAGVGTPGNARVIDSGLAVSEESLVEESLEKWRQRRDSLQTLYAELTSPHRALSEAKSRQREGRPSIEEVEWQLLYSYYQIGRLTQDEKERAAAIGFLKEYVQKAESRYKDQVEKFLEELGQCQE